MSIWTDAQGRRHVGIMVAGKRLHRILPEGATAGDAKQLKADLTNTLKAAAAARTPQLPGDPTLPEVMTLYMAHADNLRSPESAKICARRIAPWLVDYRATQAREAAAHIVRDMRADYAPATINRSLAALKKALALAHERNLIPINYGAAIKSLATNNKREMFLTVEQVSHLASCGSASVQAAVWIALLTGCRRGEILKMRQEDIGLDAITIHSGNTKTLRTRVVPIVPALRPWLKSIPLAYKDFEGLKTSFQRARIKAEMPWVNFHDLRHSCASILMATGADIYTVSKILGHSTITTTQRYAHLEVSQQRDALANAFKVDPKKKDFSGEVVTLGEKLQVVRNADHVSIHRDYLLRQRQIAAARAHAAEQKAAKEKRVARWGDRRAIWKFYRLAQKLTVETGVLHEVDHILPLKGKYVSGLHVETNLQVIPKKENRAKSNHYAA